MPGDPKGEWTVVARAVGGQAIELGTSLSTRLNPLDEGPRGSGIDDEVWSATVTARRRDLLRAVCESALGRDLQAVEATALFAALDAAVRDNSVPILSHVVEAMFRPPAEVDGSTVQQLIDDGRPVAHALNRLVRGDLSGLFDGPSTTRFDPALPMVSLDLSRIQGSDHLIALVMTCASAWMEAAIADPEPGNAGSSTTRRGACCAKRLCLPACNLSGSCPERWASRTSWSSTGCPISTLSATPTPRRATWRWVCWLTARLKSSTRRSRVKRTNGQDPGPVQHRSEGAAPARARRRPMAHQGASLRRAPPVHTRRARAIRHECANAGWLTDPVAALRRLQLHSADRSLAIDPYAGINTPRTESR